MLEILSFLFKKIRPLGLVFVPKRMWGIFTVREQEQRIQIVFSRSWGRDHKWCACFSSCHFGAVFSLEWIRGNCLETAGLHMDKQMDCNNAGHFAEMG